jgi:hypothetical protein
MKPRTERELPILCIPYTLIALPHLANPRSDCDEPMCRKSNVDTDDETRVNPYTETALPILANPRILMFEPICMKPSTLIEDPSLTMP